MVTFVSLYLWLMTGIHPIEVAVGEDVAAVEILLNGEPAGIATAPDWAVECDFGDILRPHDLTAVARDGDGAEIGRARQLINLPRDDAEVQVVLEAGTEGAPGKVEVITINREQTAPLAVFVSFDGLQLTPDADGSFPLPDHDERVIHIVSAEAHFSEGVTARTDVTFGGTYGGRIATELTAIPVVVKNGGSLSVDDLDGLLTARGRKVSVAAVEQSPAQVFVVRDHATWPSLEQIGTMIDRTDLRLRHFRRLQIRGWDAEAMAAAGDDADRFFLVVPNPSVVKGVVLYPIVTPFDIKEWGLPWLTTHVTSPGAGVNGQRLGEAMAVAGVRAAAGGSARAVVIVLSENPADASRYQPAAVREYLSSLRVPLIVWTTGSGSIDTEWGEAAPVSTEGKIRAASRRLLKSLRRQWIVWVEGRFLPSDVELAKNPEGYELAGAR